MGHNVATELDFEVYGHSKVPLMVFVEDDDDVMVHHCQQVRLLLQ